MAIKISEPCKKLSGHVFKELRGSSVVDEEDMYGQFHYEWCKHCGALVEVLRPFDDFELPGDNMNDEEAIKVHLPILVR